MRELIVKIESEIQRLRWLTAFNNFETAVRRYNLALKYSPTQPRVAAGNPDGGQWTHEGGGSGSDGRIVLASDKLPEIPKERPPSSKERLSIAKELARRLAALGRVFRRMSGVGWLLEFEPEIRSYLNDPKTLNELQQNATGPSQRGYQDHHVAEQQSAEDYGFPRSMIDAPENVVRIPTWKHHEINGWYGKPNPRFKGLSPREYLRDKDWNERTSIGLEALIDHGVLKP